MEALNFISLIDTFFVTMTKVNTERIPHYQAISIAQDQLMGALCEKGKLLKTK